QGKKTERSPNQGKKADSVANQGTKVEGITNQGKKAEGSPSQGKKAEGSPNQGKKADAAANQGKKTESASVQGRNTDVAQSPEAPKQEAPAKKKSGSKKKGEPGRTQSWPSFGRSSARSAKSWWRSQRLCGKMSSSGKLWKPRQLPSRSRSCSCRRPTGRVRRPCRSAWTRSAGSCATRRAATPASGRMPRRPRSNSSRWPSCTASYSPPRRRCAANARS
ncbi:RRBP1 isoform 10, partial [Pan troglodytes]